MSNKTIVENVNRAWNEAFNSGDLKRLVAMYSEDAVLSPGNGAVLVGREKIKGLFNSFLEGGVNSHSLEIVEVGGSDDTLFQIARWRAKGPKVDGEAPIFGGVTTSVFKKNPDGEWLAYSHIWNVTQ